MEIVYDESSMSRYVGRAMDISPGKPVLIDKFLESAIEVDVDCLSDGDVCLVGGVMQHIEEAGIHSGDSACVIPPHSLPPVVVEEIKRQTRALARELEVKGLMNVQFAVARTVLDPKRGHGRGGGACGGLHPRGQPARQPDHPVRLQGDGRSAGASRLAGHGRQDAAPSRG